MMLTEDTHSLLIKKGVTTISLEHPIPVFQAIDLIRKFHYDISVFPNKNGYKYKIYKNKIEKQTSITDFETPYIAQEVALREILEKENFNDNAIAEDLLEWLYEEPQFSLYAMNRVYIKEIIEMYNNYKIEQS